MTDLQDALRVLCVCVGCKREEYVGSLPAGEHPLCSKCFMPMIPKSAIMYVSRKASKEMTLHDAARELRWIIFFEDHDVRPEIFTDESAARQRYADLQAHSGYSCYLCVPALEAHSETPHEQAVRELLQKLREPSADAPMDYSTATSRNVRLLGDSLKHHLDKDVAYRAANDIEDLERELRAKRAEALTVEYDDALNEAAWEFTEQYRRFMGAIPSALFNAAKQILKPVIETYLRARALARKAER